MLEMLTKSWVPLGLWRRLSSQPDPRLEPLSPDLRAHLTALLREDPAWAALQELLQAEYQAELNRLINETDPNEAARRQGRLQGMQKFAEMPYRLIEAPHEPTR